VVGKVIRPRTSACEVTSFRGNSSNLPFARSYPPGLENVAPASWLGSAAQSTPLLGHSEPVFRLFLAAVGLAIPGIIGLA
jgi:hypothetical protein